MEALLAERMNHFVVDINPILRGQEYFTLQNTLNKEGKLLYWKELDNCIRLFDKRKLPLEPRKNPYDPQAVKTDSAAQLRFKLPPPPPSSVHCGQDSRRESHERSTQKETSVRCRNDDNNNINRKRKNHTSNKIWFNRKVLHNY